MSGSVELAPLNEMACPASPLYGPPALAVGGRFNTNRMLTEYVERLYLPAHRDRLAQLHAAV